MKKLWIIFIPVILTLNINAEAVKLFNNKNLPVTGLSKKSYSQQKLKPINKQQLKLKESQIKEQIKTKLSRIKANDNYTNSLKNQLKKYYLQTINNIKKLKSQKQSLSSKDYQLIKQRLEIIKQANISINDSSDKTNLHASKLGNSYKNKNYQSTLTELDEIINTQKVRIASMEKVLEQLKALQK